MTKWDEFGLNEFLYENRGIRLKKLTPDCLILEGEYVINAQMEGHERIIESVNINVTFNKKYPRVIPNVIELDSKIPRKIDNHINTSDNTFCLGSDLRIISNLIKNPNIQSFFNTIINPFLYSVFHNMHYGSFPYGELHHFQDGLVQDYEELFGIKGKNNVVQILEILSKRKRVANKLLCPCDCGQRLGKCRFRYNLLEWRHNHKRRWFQRHLKTHFEKKPKEHKNITRSVM